MKKFHLGFFSAGLMFVCTLAACSLPKQKHYYGYENDFFIPEPNMIPSMPDDKPGRTVDEMLEMTSAKLNEKENGQPVKSQIYEHSGRFGTKEKISLRKGLNADETEDRYSPKQRQMPEVVRPLKLKERLKNREEVLSEKKLLENIITPKTNEVKMIEVIPLYETRQKRQDQKQVEQMRQDRIPEHNPPLLQKEDDIKAPLQEKTQEPSIEIFLKD